MSGAPPRFTVVVPSLGREAALARLFDALAQQTLPRERFEVIVALDRPPAPAPAVPHAELARFVARTGRGGPGAARNEGARQARFEWLAFTEDDCAPAPDWLERAAVRIEAEPRLDVLEGRTVKPGGRPVHRQSLEKPLYLPTNLFVRRELFEHVGGYCEDYFDPARGLYFREDADLGFTLEEARAWVEQAADVVVEHPEEHASPRDAIRWALRHEMDPLLAARHPKRFRERIEVHRIGPFTVRRPVVRAAIGAVVCAVLALAAAALGRPVAAAAFGALALLGVLVVWAKWRFAPSHLGAALAVPVVLALALLRGRARAARVVREPRVAP